MSPFILLFLTGIDAIQGNTELYEARIYEDAPKWTPLTMNWPLERRVQPHRSCFGQLEMADEWIEFDSDRFQLLTSVNLSELVEPPVQQLTLHLLCPNSEMHSIPIHVHISRRNRHTPRFDNADKNKDLELFVPIDMALGVDFYTLPVHDHDPVVYNSLFRMSIVAAQGSPAEKFLSLTGNGSLSLKASIADLSLFRPLRFQVLVRDFGSPQLFSTANVSLVPVTISQVSEVFVNVANDIYQIIQWQRPEYGTPEKYRVQISKGNNALLVKETNNTQILLQTVLEPGPDYSILVTAIDSQGETPSTALRFAVIYDDLQCEGQCENGGRPACRRMNNKQHNLEQYSDNLGPHCICFPGYEGRQCGQSVSCNVEEVKDVYGKIFWPTVMVNGSIAKKCPLGPSSEYMSRRCVWNSTEHKAKWEMNSNANECRKQSSVLVHLGVMGNYVETSGKSVAALDTVIQFIDQLLMVEAFDPRIKNDFDPKIAEHLVQVFDLLLSKDWTMISGNITYLELTIENLLERLSIALPIPYSLHSPLNGLHLRVFDWWPKVSDDSSSGSCFLHLPPGSSSSSMVIRTICMRNSSLYPLLDSRDPVLNIKMTSNEIEQQLPEMITFGLKPHNSSRNYTCVFFDTNENDWSIKGMYTLEKSKDGYVMCNSEHLSIFSILPEEMFFKKVNLFSDLYCFLPTITSFLVIVCSLFLLLISLLQRLGSPQDPSLPVFLFLVLLLHVGLLLLLVSDQMAIGERICQLLRYPLQFLLVAVMGSIALLAQSIHLHLKAMEEHSLFISTMVTFRRCCVVFIVAIVLPAMLTALLFFVHVDDTEMDEMTCLRLSTSTITPNLIYPTTFGLAVLVTLAFSWSSMVLSRSVRHRQRLHSQKELLLNGLGNAALTCVLFALAFSAESALIHLRRNASECLLLAGAQLLLCFAVFALCGFLMRGSVSTLNSSGSADESLTRSLERKRDISRETILIPKNNSNSNGCHKYKTSIDDLNETLMINPTESLFSQNGPMVSVV